jgi:hypothetical protein
MKTGRARLQVVPINANARDPRRYGATTKKLDAFVTVAPLGRVSQYWSGYGTAEGRALIRIVLRGGSICAGY